MQSEWKVMKSLIVIGPVCGITLTETAFPPSVKAVKVSFPLNQLQLSQACCRVRLTHGIKRGIRQALSTLRTGLYPEFLSQMQQHLTRIRSGRKVSPGSRVGKRRKHVQRQQSVTHHTRHAVSNIILTSEKSQWTSTSLPAC